MFPGRTPINRKSWATVPPRQPQRRGAQGQCARAGDKAMRRSKETEVTEFTPKIPWKEFWRIFGAPCLFDDNGPEEFQAIVEQLTQALKPRDLIGQIEIDNLAHIRLNILTYRKHKALAAKVALADMLAEDKKREELKAIKRRDAQALERDRQAEPDQTYSRLAELHGVIDTTIHDVDAIVSKPLDVHRARAFERKFEYYERLDLCEHRALMDWHVTLQRFYQRHEMLAAWAPQIIDADVIEDRKQVGATSDQIGPPQSVSAHLVTTVPGQDSAGGAQDITADQNARTE
jgi:hypothetical protein